MAAKKAPMRKPVAKKPAMKKSSSIDTKNSSYNNPKAEKAGKDARGRATKYGKVVGKTTVSSSPSATGRGGKPLDYRTVADTKVISKRGNLYNVSESKNQQTFIRDKDRTTTVGAVNRDGSSRTDFRAKGKRDAKFGPAPKPKGKK